jgi:hypothetical protein
LPKPANAGRPGRIRPGERTAGRGSYLVACGWTPPTVPGPSSQEDASLTSQTVSEFLATITAELGARGLEVRGSPRQGVLAEISVSSPTYPDRGSVSIGYDGFMVWERWAPAANSDRAAGIVRLITWILAGDASTVGSAR